MTFFCPNCQSENFQTVKNGGIICCCKGCQISLLVFYFNSNNLIVKDIKSYRLSESAGRQALKDIVPQNPIYIYACFSGMAGDKISYILTDHKAIDTFIDKFPIKTIIEAFSLSKAEFEKFEQTKLDKQSLDFCWNHADEYGDVSIGIDHDNVGIYEISVTESHISFIKENIGKMALLISEEPNYWKRIEFYFYKGYEDVTENVGGYY